MFNWRNLTDVSSRRAFLAGAGALTAAAVLHQNLAHAEEPMPFTPPATPADATARLTAGNERFATGKVIAPQRDLEHLRAVAPKQTPFAAVLACADSRVPVEILYDQGFGDLFVVRVAGNIATAVEIASLEYGTRILGAKALVVLGHSNCGAVQAALDGGKVPGQISTLYQHIAPALDRKKMDIHEAVIANIAYQTRKLRKGSTVVAELLKEQKLSLVAGVFELETGRIRSVDA
jgi:carbonic anhydrase